VSASLYIVGSNIGRWVAVTYINYILIILSKEILFTKLESSRFSRGNTGQQSGIINSSVLTLGFYGNLSVFLFILFYTNLISIFRFFTQPISSKFAVSNERSSRWYLCGF